MTLKLSRLLQVTLGGAALWAAGSLHAAAPTAAQALKLQPTQKGVEYDMPEDKVLEKCSIEPEKQGDSTGWVVRDENGIVIRRFLDGNSDKVVDIWTYYSHGVEVYRDIDADHNGTADEHRWVNTGGTRWGRDVNEDGKIDRWLTISPEEVSAEIVAALADRDPARFKTLLLNDTELKELGLGADRIKAIKDKVAAASEAFTALMRTQKQLTAKSQWLQFGAIRPSLIPAGADGSTKDVVIYDGALAIVRTGDAHAQLQVGTLIQTGQAWRLIEAPQFEDDQQAQTQRASVFIKTALNDRPPAAENTGNTAPSASQKLLEELEKIDRDSNGATTPAAQAKFTGQRAEVLEKLAEAAASPGERAPWVKQYADLVSAAIQTGTYAEGLDRLKALAEKTGDDADKDLAAYVKYRYLTADNVVQLQKPDAKYEEIQKAWIASLEGFVKDYEKSPDAAEACLQLGISQEFSGEEEDAKKWYSKIVKDFPKEPAAKKASGALTRLASVGKPLSLVGKNANGQTVDLAKLKGRVVLVHYWATWCEPCKEDLGKIKELLGSAGKEGFSAVGINLDSKPEDFKAYLTQTKLTWPQLYEPGGLDSRLANELGVLTLPTMLLLDQSGKVVNRNLHISELDTEVKKLLKK